MGRCVCVDLSSRQSPNMSGKYGCTLRSPFATARWVFKRIKVATARCGCISLMPTLEAIPQHTKKHDSPGTKRPFAQFTGHPYDPYVLP